MNYLSTRSDILNLIPQQSIIGEIGVFKGGFSKIIEQMCDPKELHLIDLFDGPMVSGDKDGNNIITINLSEEYTLLDIYFKNHTNVFLHKGKSKDILAKFPNNYFNFLYVDGDHSYEGVSIDLELGRLKVKDGGILSGHDYHSQLFPGVYQAVNHFCHKYNLKIDYLSQDKLPSYGIYV